MYLEWTKAVMLVHLMVGSKGLRLAAMLADETVEKLVSKKAVEKAAKSDVY
jgi:hypothetical protein